MFWMVELTSAWLPEWVTLEMEATPVAKSPDLGHGISETGTSAFWSHWNSGLLVTAAWPSLFSICWDNMWIFCYFFFWPGCTACGMFVPQCAMLSSVRLFAAPWTVPCRLLYGIFQAKILEQVPQSGIKPGPPAMEAWSPNHWTTREFPPFPDQVKNQNFRVFLNSKSTIHSWPKTYSLMVWCIIRLDLLIFCL